MLARISASVHGDPRRDFFAPGENPLLPTGEKSGSLRLPPSLRSTMDQTGTPKARTPAIPWRSLGAALGLRRRWLVALGALTTASAAAEALSFLALLPLFRALLAGAQGGLFVLHQQAFTVAEAQASFGIFIAAVVGGLGSTLGALLGSLFFWGTFWWLEGSWRLFASAIGVLAVLLIAPGGLAGLAYQGRDWLLRRLAARRQIHVPALVADDRFVTEAGTEPGTRP